jgi:hypothetical protein
VSVHVLPSGDALRQQPQAKDSMSISSAALIGVACSVSGPRARTTRDGSRHLVGAHGADAAKAVKARRTEAMIAGVMPTRSTLFRGHELDPGVRRQMCTANWEGRPLSRHRGDAALRQQSRKARFRPIVSRHWPNQVEPLLRDSLGHHDRLADSHRSGHGKKREVCASPGGSA